MLLSAEGSPRERCLTASMAKHPRLALYTQAFKRAIDMTDDELAAIASRAHHSNLWVVRH